MNTNFAASLADQIRTAGALGRLRRYQAKVGRTVAVLIPEENADPLYWSASNYCNAYGFPVAVKAGGKWQHPSGTPWAADIAALLDAAPFSGGVGG